MNGYGPPNLAERTTQADNRQQIVLLILLAFTVHVLANMQTNRAGKRLRIEDVPPAIMQTNLPAWAVVAVILLIASDFDSTSRVSVAFAGLLTIAVVISDGQKAFKLVGRIPAMDFDPTPGRSKQTNKPTNANVRGGGVNTKR